uniref:Putative RNA-binding protein C17H9.04c n=1 Tax=Noccaea caerulescens TaxID=107243 RepID=A0A1J3GKJ2_NOCCA
MNRPGDWNCRSCSHLNFQRRDSCQRCGEPRLGIITDLVSGFAGRPHSSSFGFNTGPDVRPGDWYCSLGNCGTHNFASRSSCFKCGAAKDESLRSAATGFIDMSDGPRRGLFGFGSSSGGGGGGGTGRSSWKSGDWICSRPGCNEHNFASRSECFRCNAPKEHATNPPY